ncbi:hypothetical protein [Aquibacillus rhizosphaerae]|uniref:Uncharacterized protein n=1 Tax=Aquibacillus rhizosphaerae TaxID=3051431 RepID=A0ABT7LAF9_9BACI|nr:hypothetical protein [Aquibacillus sp. LR5S19]MDL4842848.1 hypothetical protein [Aquibacillus sp. LR5S19]
MDIVTTDINTITVTGNGLGYFIEDTEEQSQSQPNYGKVVLKQEEEMEVIIKAIKNSTPYSGPMTVESENLNLILNYKDNTSETILLWLYPERNSSRSSRIQKEDYEGPLQILNKEDVENIAKLLAEKLS